MHFLSKKPDIHVELLVENQKLLRIFLKKPLNQEGFTYSWIQETPPLALEREVLFFLQAYAQKKRCALPDFFSILSSSIFTSSVLKAIADISFGETKTYGEIARLIKQPNAARAVGRACNGNPFPLFIPCHRVVGAKGKLGGFATGTDVKQEILNFEKS